MTNQFLSQPNKLMSSMNQKYGKQNVIESQIPEQIFDSEDDAG